MAVVAVLLSHIDRKDEVIIIPSMSLGKKLKPQAQISNIVINAAGLEDALFGIRITLNYRIQLYLFTIKNIFYIFIIASKSKTHNLFLNTF